MIAVLPPHAAAEDEPIPPLGARKAGDGPDMRKVAPIAVMMSELRAFDADAACYIATWRQLFGSVGCSLLAHYDAAGELGLMVSVPCDAQCRHRNRWVEELLADLDRVDGRRDILLTTLIYANLIWDERPRVSLVANDGLAGMEAVA